MQKKQQTLYSNNAWLAGEKDKSYLGRKAMLFGLLVYVAQVYP